MKSVFYLLCGLLCLTIIHSCKENQQTEFRDFFNGKEIVYTGAVNNVIIQPGNLRIGLKWKASTDPSITKYVVYYNNKVDSQVVNIPVKIDTIRTVIENLSEYTYSFTIYSYDDKGNKSIPYEVNNAKVYGPVYESSLLNRPYNFADPYIVHADGSVTLNFSAPDTINVNTRITYINQEGATVSMDLKADQSTVTIPDYKSGTDVLYTSAYIPTQGAVDTFYVKKAEKFPRIFGYAVCDKSLFRKLKLQHDINPLSPATDIDKLWDGSVGPQDYPNLFHSDDKSTMPGTITFDLGKLYSLRQLEQTGRKCCHNPVQFEVWGITDITNAETLLVPNQPGWTEETIAKGWILLKDVKRTDDGRLPLKFDLDATAEPVRYIRIRIKQNANGSMKEANMSELTFFYDVFNP